MIAIKNGEGSLNLQYIKNNLPMSLLNNNNKKDKKKNQQKQNAPGFPSPKGKTNSKAISKNSKLTGGGGSQRGS
jgi:hypothetical protein